MAGQVESEIKLRTQGPEAARAALAALGARLVHARHFEDNVLLDDEHGGLGRRGRLLRLRRTPQGGRLTYKGPRLDSGEVKAREEIEGPVAGIHAAAAALGYARGDYVTDSYAGLFFAAGGRGDMLF